MKPHNINHLIGLAIFLMVALIILNFALIAAARHQVKNCNRVLYQTAVIECRANDELLRVVRVCYLIDKYEDELNIVTGRDYAEDSDREKM